MKDKALELLEIFNNKGYEAFIVGGFVRDYVLGKDSFDIDIATNATPKQIKEIFNDVSLPFEGYGSVHLTYKKVNFEITTYRMDLEYKDKRKPSKIVYTDKLLIDLKRRDFTINTLCMDKNGNIYDLLNVKDDINKKIIKTVGNADKRLKEDSLRILRAIRFACSLNFNIDKELEDAIIDNRDSLKELSFFRKKQELNRIFSSPNALYGISLLKKFHLDNYLGIKLSNDIVKTTDPIGIWAQISPDNRYQFTNNEKLYLKNIKDVVAGKKIEKQELYTYGNYICSIAGQILKIDSNLIYDKFDSMQIKKKDDIKVKPSHIINELNLEDKSKVKAIYKDIEYKLLDNKLKNDYEEIIEYLVKKYK